MRIKNLGNFSIAFGEVALTMKKKEASTRRVSLGKPEIGWQGDAGGYG